jgi:hypothetical protein
MLFSRLELVLLTACMQEAHNNIYPNYGTVLHLLDPKPGGLSPCHVGKSRLAGCARAGVKYEVRQTIHTQKKDHGKAF